MNTRARLATLAWLALVAALLVFVLAFGASISACRANDSEPPRPAGKLRVVFKHQPMWGDPATLREILASFERAHPDIEVVTEVLPNASEVTHQYFLTALGGGTRDFDVFVADVIWVPEFARAGWIADLTTDFPPETLRREMVPGAADAVIVDGRTFAVPWYIDVGILYYRTDLVPRAPRTYDDLVQFARDAKRANPSLYGYVWQGRQTEGLVCNAFEAIWGHGGETMRSENGQAGHVQLDTPQARAGLGYLRSLVESGVSPPSVTSAAEEESRRIFQEGRAVFMRNWPYAWSELQKEGSPVRGNVGFAPLPTSTGEPGAGALGGWQLTINARSPSYKRTAARDLIAHLTTLETNVKLAVAYARNPPRIAAYDDPRLKQDAPFIASLRPAITRARPRPVTPYYDMMSDVLQGEFSAGVSGIRPPDEALARAQKLVDRIAR